MKILSAKFAPLAYLWCLSSSILSFCMLVVPVIMRQQGFDLATIGMMYALAMPQLFKWIWGPFIDKFSPLGKAESGWLGIILVATALCMGVISMLELKENFWLIFGLMMFGSLTSNLLTLVCCSIVVKQHSKDEQGWLNGLMVSTMSVGMILGGGLLLYVYESLGWQGSLLTLALASLLGLFMLPKTTQQTQSSEKVQFKRIWTLFKKPGIRKWALIMMLFYGANQGVYAMIKPFMVDVGISNQSIALLTGLFSSIVGVIAGVLGSIMVKKLGARNSLNMLAALLAISVVCFIQVEGHAMPLLWLYPACGLLIFSSFAAFTVVCIVSMTFCDEETAATDFSILSVLPYLGAMPLATLSGWITESLGYKQFFILSAVLSIASVILIYLVYRGEKDVFYRNQADQEQQIIIN